jgi:hypothetical protein
MIFPLSGALLGLQLVVTIADRVPDLNVRPGCRQSNIPDCLSKEQNARKMLIEEWPRFKAQDKTKCVEEAKLGGVSTSYVGLQTCLQFKENIRNIPAAPKQPSSTIP